MGFKEVSAKADAIQKAVEEGSVLVGPVGGGKVPGLDFTPGLYGLDTYAHQLRKVSDSLKSSMFKTLFMGTFKNGKSTTINAILGREMLPVAATACTAVISQVVFGKDVRHVKVFKEGVKEPEILTVEQFTRDYKLTKQDMKLINEKGSLDRFQDVDYVLMENDASLFQDGVQLIDSPGLEEAKSRTKATERFYPQANAVVFLLDATHLFSDKEKMFIRNHFVYAEPKPRNVFFVVNRINQLNSDEERQDVMEDTKTILEPVFTENGTFNEALFRQRVFFVNAYKAFTMRQEGLDPKDTGMVEFQAALEDFLTSEDRIIARYQPAVANLASAYVEAERFIKENSEIMKKPLAVIQENAANSEAALSNLEGEISSMARVIQGTEELVENKILNDLERFVQIEMPNNWKSHVSMYDEKFGIMDMVKLALPFSNEKKSAILQPMSKFISDFVEEELVSWSDRISLLIQPDIDRMREDLQDKSRDFDLKLSAARSLFTGQKAEWDSKGPNKLQMILSLIQGDYSVAVENAAGGNFDWGEFAKRYIVQGVINILVFSLVGGGPLGLAVALGIEFFQMTLRAGAAREKILNNLANQMFPQIAKSLNMTKKAILEEQAEVFEEQRRFKDAEKVRQEAANITGKDVPAKESIKKDIRQQFKAQEDMATQSARSLIEDERKNQAAILEQMSRTKKENEAESKRQQKVLDALRQRIAFVYKTIYGRELTEQSIKNLAAAVAVGQTQME